MTTRSPIAFLLPDLPEGGVEKSTIRTTSALSKLGCDVDIVLIKKRGDLLSEVPPSVNLVSLSDDFGRGQVDLGLLSTIARFRRYLRFRRPFAVISAKERANVPNVLGSWMTPARPTVVLMRRTSLLHGSGADSRWYTPLLYRFLYGGADAILCISNGLVDEIKSVIPIARHHKLHLVRNPVLPDDFFSRAEAEVALPNVGASPLFVGVGRLSQQKGFDILIRALATLRMQPAPHLVLVGDGEEQGKLSALAVELGVADRVHFIGYVPNPLPYIKAADVVAFPSRWEGFGNVIVEALALGVRVISSDCPSGPREILENGRWGKLVKVADIENLADALAAPPPNPVHFDFSHYMAKNSAQEYLNVLSKIQSNASDT